MGNMRFKVGDRVRIKSIDWYNENKNKFGNVWGHYPFDKDMSKYCGKVMTISHIRGDHYTMVENLVNYWTDNMIECKVEEETKPHNNMCKQLIDEMNPNVEVNVKVKTKPETTCEGKKRCVVYFWDNDFADKVELDLSNRELIQEDGKWFVVKKKKEYPKTYEECCRIVNANPCIRLVYNLSDGQKYYHDEDNLYLYENFRRLKICRDAYWKIAGEEMGLGKPWKPDWEDGNLKWCMSYSGNYIEFDQYKSIHHTLAFPTEEMRDAFYDNFKELINECKELL